jgi:hypothetical protein
MPSQPFGSPQRVAVEARLIYALLDAFFEEAQAIESDQRQTWIRIRAAAERSEFDAVAREGYALLNALENARRLEGSWIQARWVSLRERLQNEQSTRESRAPW